MNTSLQNVAVLGCGRSGAAAADLAARHGGKVTVFDSGDPTRLADTEAKLQAAGHQTVFGKAALSAKTSDFDLVVTSPGIALEWDIAQQFIAAGVRLVGEMEFAFPYCEADLVAVTGTNGKTTTVELLEIMLNGCGETAVAAGNYGLPLSAVANSGTDYSVVALEVSSFQLEAIETFRPEIGVWTNFAPDHLDRYPDVNAYRAAKLRLFENQTADDWAVLNARDELGSLSAQTVTFSAFAPGADLSYQNGAILRNGEVLFSMGDVQLRGTHNAENLMATFAAGAIRGHRTNDMLSAVATYRAPAHRCELVGTVAGVEFINDSKATNLHAMESALVAAGDEKVILIAGGKDKGLPFADLSALVGRHAEHAVLIGEIRDALASAWGDVLSCSTAGDLDEAVRVAAGLAKPGQTVLFAPGTSSFDMFSGYEQRGEVFRAAVAKL